MLIVRFFRLRNIHKNLINIRFASSQVRVRFAPSPTGNLHLGGLRTALYNFLFAKQNYGKFILRIEDTDQTRLVPGSIEKICNDILWAGMKIDEGPGTTESPYGPYIQSQRLHLYKKHVETLLKTGHAYYCFCTEKRLDLLRKQAAKNREVAKYDNRCRSLNYLEAKTRVDKGDKPCIRFKLNEDADCCNFKDLIYGDLKYDITKNEGDPIIVKSDGFPTYHIANVIDDHLMEISHVLRGLEWQISTPKHLMMYKAFGWTPPLFGHLPLLLDATGNKLSKRMDHTRIEFYQNSGILPNPLLNFVITSGGGFCKESSDEDVPIRCYDMAQLIVRFKLSDIKTSPGKLDFNKLYILNRLELEKQLKNKENKKKLVQLVQNMVRKHFIGINNDSLQVNNEHVESVLQWSIKRINTLEDLIKDDLIFLWIIPDIKMDNINELDTLVIKSICIDFDKGDMLFEREFLNRYLEKKAQETKVKYSSLMKFLRLVLSGLKVGPSVAEMMEILGKQNTILRLKLFLDKVQSDKLKENKNS